MKIRLLAAAAAVAAWPALSITESPTPVDHIAAADEIQGWTLVDNRHVVVQLGAQRHYMLTLSQDCYRLNWAQHVGVTSSDNTIYAGFDYVTADGWQCGIERIEQLPAQNRL